MCNSLHLSYMYFLKDFNLISLKIHNFNKLILSREPIINLDKKDGCSKVSMNYIYRIYFSLIFSFSYLMNFNFIYVFIVCFQILHIN